MPVPPNPEGPDPEEPEPEERVSATAGRKRWLPAVLLVAAAVAIMPLAGDLPNDHQVELLLAQPEGVRGVELTWLQGDDVIRSASYRFGPGDEPRIRAEVRVPSGDYRLLVVLDRAGQRVETEHQVHFDNEVEAVSITLR